MKKQKRAVIIAIALMSLAVVYTGCPTEDADEPGEKTIPDTTQGPVPQDAIDPNNPETKRNKKVANDGQQVIHEVWMGIDTQADPRNAIGYRLATSKKQFFDNVVIFHSGISWDHLDPDRGGNRPAEAQTAWCPQTGIHHHLDSKTQYLLDNYDRYLKPIKDAGMRLLICPLPGGQGVTYGTIGCWPGGDDVWQQEMQYPYPADDAFAREWARSLADFCAQYNFDGIALDEEYGDVSSGKGYGLREKCKTQNAAIGGQNIFRWLRYFKDYTTDASHPNGKWVSAYWHERYVQNLPETLSVDDPRTADVDNRSFSINDVVDAAFPSSYGSTMTRANGLTKEKIGYTSIAFDAFSNVSISPDAIKGTINTMMRGRFGVIMYFALRERRNYSSIPFFGAIGTMPEDYLTRIAEVLYRDQVIYEGQDYWKFPIVDGQAEKSLAEYGSLYGHRPSYTPDY
jgi:hypothetical protein